MPRRSHIGKTGTNVFFRPRNNSCFNSVNSCAFRFITLHLRRRLVGQIAKTITHAKHIAQIDT